MEKMIHTTLTVLLCGIIELFFLRSVNFLKLGDTKAIQLAQVMFKIYCLVSDLYVASRNHIVLYLTDRIFWLRTLKKRRFGSTHPLAI
jgi:hypothetical protein